MEKQQKKSMQINACKNKFTLIDNVIQNKTQQPRTNDITIINKNTFYAPKTHRSSAWDAKSGVHTPFKGFM